MAAVKISAPSASEIRESPREFALLTQVPGYADDSIKAEDLANFAQKYGEGKVDFKGEVSFAEVSKAFSKKGRGTRRDKTAGLAAHDKTGHLTPFEFERRSLSAEDIRIQTTYAGICHTDLHQLKSEWGDSMYPIVPGHEIIGVVTEVGEQVSMFRVGDRAGIGCFIDSCRECEQCHKDEGQFCNRMVPTYNGKNWRHKDEVTYGGYSTDYVIASEYAIKIPESLDMSTAAPLLCAGITTYSPIMRHGLNKPGKKLGVVGLGGLGHMAVKFGKALGAEVTVISTSEEKRGTAKKLGADHFIISKDEKQMLEHAETLDGIIDTVSGVHPISTELGLLKIDGVMVLVGVPTEPLEFQTFALVGKRRSIAGSMIGGIAETQEMIDFCAKHDISCECEVIDVEYANKALDRLAEGDIHGRFSIDVQRTLIA